MRGTLSANEALRLSAEIYDASIKPELWEGVLDRLTAEVGAKGAVVLILETLGQYRYSVNHACSLYTESDRQRYVREYARYEANDFAKIANSKPGEIVLSADYVADPTAFRKRPDVVFLEERYGVFERFAVRLNGDRAWFDYIVFQYDRTRSNVRPREEAKLRKYLPHIARSVDMSRPFSELRLRYQAVLGALDRFFIAVFLVLSSSQVLACNRAARMLIDSGDGLSVSKRGELTAHEASSQSRLRAAIAKASAVSAALGLGGSSQILVPKISGREPYLVEVSPIRDTAYEIDRNFKGAFLTVIDPDLRITLGLEGLRKLYELTAAETAVAELLFQGRTNDEIAEIRGVSLETVKAQVRALLAKTNARNRTELVSRLFSVTLPIE